MKDNTYKSEAGHWYDRAGEPMYTIIGANGKERNTNLRDAKSLGLVPSVTTVMKIIAINKLINKAAIVVNAIAQWVHLARCFNEANSIVILLSLDFFRSLKTLCRSTMRDNRFAITVRVAPSAVSKNAGATAI